MEYTKCPYCGQDLNLEEGHEEAVEHISEHLRVMRESALEVADEQLEIENPEGNLFGRSK